MEMPIYYDGQEIGTRRVDFFVEDKVMVELKAVSRPEASDMAAPAGDGCLRFLRTCAGRHRQEIRIDAFGP